MWCGFFLNNSFCGGRWRTIKFFLFLLVYLGTFKKSTYNAIFCKERLHVIKSNNFPIFFYTYFTADIIHGNPTFDIFLKTKKPLKNQEKIRKVASGAQEIKK